MNLHIDHEWSIPQQRLQQRKIPWAGNGRPKFVALRDKMVALDGISLALSVCGMVESGMQPTKHSRGRCLPQARHNVSRMRRRKLCPHETEAQTNSSSSNRSKS
jgi:hypothetical protein